MSSCELQQASVLPEILIVGGLYIKKKENNNNMMCLRAGTCTENDPEENSVVESEELNKGRFGDEKEQWGNVASKVVSN